MSLLTSISESILKTKNKGTYVTPRSRDRSTRPVVLPYFHRFSHGIKKIANKFNINVVFSAPIKLGNLCKKVNAPDSHRSVCCTKNHRNRFVECAEEVVYSFPLSCGKVYIGQTGRCLNDRLREHKTNSTRANSGHLGIHCRDCGCDVHLPSCTILGRNSNQLTREIIEAEHIARNANNCISTPSLHLTEKEKEILGI